MIERYTRPEMGRIWSEENRFRTWLKVEIAACKAWHELGAIPDAALAEIEDKADFNIDRIRELEATLDHETIAFLTCVKEYVGDSARYIHMGLTSSDKLDTATALQLVESLDLIQDGVEALIDKVAEQSETHKETVCIGRSHGVHAEPTTFGLKLLIYLEELRRHQERLDQLRPRIAVGKFSGPVGTFSNLDPRVEEITCRHLGLEAANVTNQIVQRDRHAEYLNVLALIGCTLEKMATEVRGLQRTEIREVQEPFPPGQKGSSSMPHKKNPNLSERICGLSRILRANALVGMENVTLWHERDISHSSAERVVINDSSILADYLLDRMTYIMRDMVVDTERMKSNLEMTGGLVFSQKVLIALIQHELSREDSYAIVQRCAMKVWDEGGTLLETVWAEPQVQEKFKREDLEACFNLEAVLEHVDHIYSRTI